MDNTDCSNGACDIKKRIPQHSNINELYDRINKLEASLTAKDKLIAELRIDRIKKADAMLPPPIPEDDYKGLKVKYRVYKVSDNTPVEDCFVLRPNKGDADCKALITYAQHCGNLKLAKDINKWIRSIYDARSKNIEQH